MYATAEWKSRRRAAACVLFALLGSSALGQLTNLTVEPTCVPGGTDVQGTVTVAPCRPFLSCCVNGTCTSVTVNLSASSSLLAEVPSQVSVPRPMNVPGIATFNIGANPPLICFPDPCPVASVTITASDASAERQAGIAVWQPNAFVEDFALDPPTVLGGTIALARVTLQCPAPPGGWAVQISSDDKTLASPVVDGLVIPEGDDSGVIEITTVPVTHLRQANITVTAAGVQRTRTLTVLPGSLDLTVRKIEVTQGVQYLDDDVFADNSLPLVRGKSTAVRAYLESNTILSVPNVPVTLTSRPCGTTDWVEHAPLWPYAMVTPTDADDPLDTYRLQRETPNPWERDRLNATFLIDPADLESGCRDFRADVNPDALIVEEDYSNNVYADSGFLFNGTRNLNVKFVRINWCPGCPFDDSPSTKPNWNTIYPMVALLEKTYPVDRVNFWKARKEVAITSLTPNDFEKDAAWGYVLGALATLKGFTNDEAPDMFYYGLLDAGVPQGNCGPETTIHEIGHNIGRLHAPCGDPDDVDPNWPSSTNPNTLIGQTGFDVDARLALPGSPLTSGPQYVDFMSYCAPEWVSPYTYLAIYDHFTSASVTGDEAAPAGELADHLMVRGVIDAGGAVQFASFYHQDFPSGLYDQEGAGSHSVVLRGDNEQALFTRRLTPQLVDADGGRAFFEIVPYQPGTLRVDLTVPGLVGDQVVESRDVSMHPPSIELTSPNGGEAFGDTGTLDVSWTASDPDGDPLVFAVLYSRDTGVTWEALAVDVDAAPFEADLSQLAGSNQGMFRVVASDGVNTASDDSDAVFSVAGKPPEPAILSPTDRSRIPLDSPVALRGAAADPEDGPIADEFLVWLSSRDGLLGGGTGLVTRLSPGVHRITLEGQDTDGNAAEHCVSVVVGPVGDCDDDQDVDQADLATGLACFGGPAGAMLDPLCACADVDGDDDVDLFDAVFLQEAFGRATAKP